MNAHHDWIAGLAAGSEVIVTCRYSPSIAKVDRVTATQIVVGNQKFRRSDGRLVGGNSWSTTGLKEPTQKDRDSIEAAQLRERIAAVAKNPKTSLAALRAMAVALAGEAA